MQYLTKLLMFEDINMVEKIIKYKSNDGLLFDSEQEAIKHDTKCEFTKSIEELFMYSSNETIPEVIFNNADDFHKLLTKLLTELNKTPM